MTRLIVKTVSKNFNFPMCENLHINATKIVLKSPFLKSQKLNFKCKLDKLALLFQPIHIKINGGFTCYMQISLNE